MDKIRILLEQVAEAIAQENSIKDTSVEFTPCMLSDIAVSYTHLDVYKRQSLGCARTDSGRVSMWIYIYCWFARSVQLSLIHILIDLLPAIREPAGILFHSAHRYNHPA